MIIRNLWFRRKNQQGFTLVEMLAALAITSFIGLGASMATIQVINQGDRNGDYTTASRNTLNAIHWISRDAQMAQVVDLGASSGFPLELSWVEWDNSTHEATYFITDGDIKRSYSIDGGAPAQTLVAQYINTTSENTTCGYSSGVLTLKVTSTVGAGSKAISVTKLREITPRPGI
jgi:prepilin-type N-terminal cleavage/methylation domain-containing protein